MLKIKIFIHSDDILESIVASTSPDYILLTYAHVLGFIVEELIRVEIALDLQLLMKIIMY